MGWRIIERLTNRRHKPAPPAPGDLVTVVVEDQFGVMKILVVDEGGVHARLFVERFAQRPSNLDGSGLSLAAFGTEHNNPFSIGHVPLSHKSFSAWKPQLCGRSVVVDEELEGYRMWRDAKAGYF